MIKTTKMDNKFTIEAVVEYMENTKEESWCTDVVKSKDGASCFFGHIFDMGSDQKESNRLWQWFESMWATEYMIYPVNDGKVEKYNQPTPKQRIVAYIKDLRDGKEKNTQDHFNDYDEWRVKDLHENKHVLSIEQNAKVSDTTTA